MNLKGPHRQNKQHEQCMEVRKGLVSTGNFILFSVAGAEFKVESGRLGKIETHHTDFVSSLGRFTARLQATGSH